MAALVDPSAVARILAEMKQASRFARRAAPTPTRRLGRLGEHFAFFPHRFFLSLIQHYLQRTVWLKGADAFAGSLWEFGDPHVHARPSSVRVYSVFSE
jgi:hypothetical protein